MGWPFIGETLQFLKPHKSNSLGSFLEERCSSYGKVFKSHIFGSPTIVSCDYEFNTFILQNEGKLFPVDYPKVMHKILGKYALILVTGELHKKLRSTVISFVSASKSESNFLHFVEMLAISRINSWGSNCKQVAFYREAKKFSINVMLKHLLNMNPNDPLASKILDNFEKYIKGFISLPLNFPGTIYSNAVKARLRLSSIIKDIIAERRKANNVEVEGVDLLNLILSKENLSDEEMVSIVLDLLFGGYETTSKLLSLIVYFLDGAPDALKCLKEEHEMIRKSKMEGELLNWEDYKKMEFTQNVINEAMRCGNVVKYLHRKATKDVKFKEFVIPAGWKVFPVLLAPHLDPNNFENPLEFNPFRWNVCCIGQEKKVAPFGGGPRLCPGADLAKVEIAFFLHHLILNYRWKMKTNDDPIAFPFVEFIGGLLLDLQPTTTTFGKQYL
ncbi:unnamed protein product [Lathyrus oleraceus]